MNKIKIINYCRILNCSKVGNHSINRILFTTNKDSNNLIKTKNLKRFITISNKRNNFEYSFHDDNDNTNYTIEKGKIIFLFFFKIIV